MTWIKNLFSVFSNIKTVMKFIGYYNEVKRIKAAYPGVTDEIMLRAWLVENVDRLTAFTQTTSNVIDDTIAYYVSLIIENDNAWKIMYHSLCMAVGHNPNEVLFGESVAEITKLIESEQIVSHKGNVVSLNHEQLTQIATCVVLTTVAQMQAA